MRSRWALAAVAAAVCASAPASAQSVEDFYRGRNVIVTTPDQAGSGYDQYARVVARYIGDKIPGKPTIIVQNIPGAGGIIQLNQMYNAMAKDGSVFGIMQHGNVFRPIFDPREVRFKIEGFRFLGSVTPIVVIGAVTKDAPAKTASDLFEREVLIGGSAGTTAYVAPAINRVINTKMKMISGYKSSKEVVLAMLRGEVHGTVGIGLDSLQSFVEGKTDQFNILFQLGSVRAKELPNVPLIQEFAKTPEDKATLEAAFASVSLGRLFVTPAIPDDRFQALQKAFEATVKDPAFVETAKKQGSGVDYIPPEQIKAIVDRVYGLPASVQKRAAEALAGAG